MILPEPGRRVEIFPPAFAELALFPRAVPANANEEPMNRNTRDLLVDCAINRQTRRPAHLPQELAAHLERILVDRELLDDHIHLLRTLHIQPADLTPFEIRDVILYGVRGQPADLTVRLLLTPAMLCHIANLIRECVQEALQHARQ